MRNKNLGIVAVLLFLSLKSAFSMNEEDCPEFSRSSGGQPIRAQDPTEPVKSIRPNIPLLSFHEPETESKDQTSPKMDLSVTNQESPKIESPTTTSPKRKISKTLPVRQRRGSSPRIGVKSSTPPRSSSTSPRSLGSKRKNSAPLERIPVFPQKEPTLSPGAENLDPPGRRRRDREASPRNIRVETSGSFESPGREGAIAPPRRNSQGKVPLRLNESDKKELKELQEIWMKKNVQSTSPPEDEKHSPTN